MKLDKRIKVLTDIQSVTSGCHDEKLMNKKGYFAESITDFENLKKCVYAEYIGYREHERCFHYWDEKNGKDYTHYARYFIPEDSLLPEEKPEKKYRPFSIEEWNFKHSVGNTILYRYKGTYCGDHCEAELMYLGYIKPLDGITDEAGKGQIVLGNNAHGLQILFDDYEIWADGEWQPFGIEVKENE